MYLRRKNKIIVDRGSGAIPIRYIATAIKNIECLGYTLSRELVETVATLSSEDFERLYLKLIEELKEIVGADVVYSPMYPNFPKQVMDATDAELYINAIMHYFGDAIGVRIIPDYEKEERLPLFDITKLTVIGLGNDADFCNIATNLLSSNTSLSETDKSDLLWFIANRPNDITIPDNIPHKENMCYFFGKMVKRGSVIGTSIFRKHFKTATDVLRFAVALSGGDVSLGQCSMFKSFNRKERRLILFLLENCNNIKEDMDRHRTAWIRLGERLHPFERGRNYETHYPKCIDAFDAIRNNKPISTFNGRVEEMLKCGDFYGVLKELCKRPGDMARRLDHVLRISPDKTSVVVAFDGVVKEVSTPVLLQVKEHFKHRNDEKDIRVFFPKGNTAKVCAVDNNLPHIDSYFCDKVYMSCHYELARRFYEIGELGNVYVDKRLADYLVPFSQRSASKAIKTLVRGSKISIGNCDALRFFIWWKDTNGRVDIDLSAVMFDDSWNYVEHISYTNLRSKYKACHSGDITSAPRGACEFIDVDIDSMLSYGCRYVVMNVLSYTGQKFAELPKCYAGWMERQDVASGEVFEPRTVKNRIDVASDSRICIPIVVDLVERKVVWADVTVKESAWSYNNIEGNMSSISLIGRALTRVKKPNLFDLFTLHAIARGTLVSNKKDADVVFSVDDGITPFDVDIICNEYLC